MGFPRQEYWSGLPFPPPGDLPDPGIEPTSPALAGGVFITEPPGKPQNGDAEFLSVRPGRIEKDNTREVLIPRMPLKWLQLLFHHRMLRV